MQITFDENHAKEPISFLQAGKYVGSIFQARYNPESNSVAFIFKPDNGPYSEFSLSLAPNKKDPSKPGYGMRLLQSLMGLTGVKQLNSVSYTGKLHVGSKVKTTFEVFPQFKDKRFGVLLESTTDYENMNKNGYPSYFLNVVRFFDPDTNKTYTELTTGKEAKVIDELASKLEDHVKGTPQQNTSTSAPKPAAASTSSPLDIDEDCPF